MSYWCSKVLFPSFKSPIFSNFEPKFLPVLKCDHWKAEKFWELDRYKGFLNFSYHQLPSASVAFANWSCIPILPEACTQLHWSGSAAKTTPLFSLSLQLWEPQQFFHIIPIKEKKIIRVLFTVLHKLSSVPLKYISLHSLHRWREKSKHRKVMLLPKPLRWLPTAAESKLLFCTYSQNSSSAMGETWRMVKSGQE